MSPQAPASPQAPVAASPRRSKLSGAQLDRLPGLLERGPSAFGFCGEIGTRRQVAQFIER